MIFKIFQDILLKILFMPKSWKNLTDSGVCKMAEAVSQFSIGITSLNFSFVSWELSDKAIEKVASAITKFSEYLTNLMIGFERLKCQILNY